jgi:UDP:flavonoid glycosyltransferase YjiC (YdhE family)
MARTDLVITVGGCGTIFGALSAGVPLIVVPDESDQPANARRVVESRTGIYLSRRRCTAHSLRACVEHVLECPSYRRNAQQMAEILARYEGSARAVRLIEELLKVDELEVLDETQKCLGSEDVLSQPASFA